jgi:hypothetical protein
MGKADPPRELPNATEAPPADGHVPAKRRALLVGTIALLTGTIAGTMYLSSLSSANACPDPPCPAPGPNPP